MYDLFFCLPELNYSIKDYERLDSYKEDIAKIKMALEKTINHTQLTRELLVQLRHRGTVLGTWLGDKREPYFHVFDNLDYIYPYGIYKNYGMVGVFDLEYVDTLKEEQKEVLFNTLSPLITKKIYEKWKNCSDSKKKKELQLVVLPPEKSLVARIKVLGRNQRLGLPSGTSAIVDLQHKQKMKELERAIADKIIRALAIVKMRGKDDNGNEVKSLTRKKVFREVKNVLEKSNNSKTGITVVGLPDFATFEYPDVKGGDDLLDPKKYDSINNDITTSIGISPVLLNGTGGNYASANINLDMIYREEAVMLEQIETIYNQLIVIALGKKKGKNYKFEYNKQPPLSKTDKLNTLKTLVDKGYALRPLIEMVGLDYESYIQESLYEIEEQELRKRIIPPLSTYTTTKKDTDYSETEPNNDSTVKSTELDGNNNPKPSTK